ncbi:type IV secretion system DNA-binding domain-containing protein [Asticcacaulis sp. W401b]|uniref:type IV secretion system DNA-binding domain-containing protein n=1 Tax=Asticcacaulis sp. W401b TaxID=3388666 RepID=UPI0039708EBD
MSDQKPRPERTAGAAWLRGGQTISHTLEMIWEIAKKFLIMLALWGVFCIYSVNKHATDDEQLYGSVALLVKVFQYFGSPMPQQVTVRQPDGTELIVPITEYESLPYVAAVLDRYGELLFYATILFLAGAAALLALATVLFIRQGQLKLEDKELRGQTIASVTSLRAQIQKFNADEVRKINRRIVERLTGRTAPAIGIHPETGFKAAYRDWLYVLKSILESPTDSVAILRRKLRPGRPLLALPAPSTGTALVPYTADGDLRLNRKAERYYQVIDLPYWVSNRLSKSDADIVHDITIRARAAGAGDFYERFSEYEHHRIVGVELPINSLFQHTLVVGSPGSGKSQAIHGLIESIIRRRECAIIYDPELEYIRAHYKEGRDVILNPFDRRTASWSPFNDLADYASWEQAAADLFPLPKGSQDPYWTLASRQIYCNAGYKLGVIKRQHFGEKPTIEELIWLIIGDFETLHYFLKNTPAERTLGEKEGLRSESLRSVIVNGITRMMHLLDGREDFSISDWINGPQSHGLLFLSRPQHLEASLTPLIAHWSSIAITTLFTRTPEQSKKITHIILDEFHSLGKVEILADAPARLRKYGGSMIMGMQQVSQLDDIYGDKKAQTIIGQLATKLILRCQDPDTARSMAEQIGQREVSRTQENTSYGAHQLRDGVSLNTKEQTEFVFMPEEIMNFPMFQGVLRVSNVREGRPFPVAPVKFRYRDRSTDTEGFTMRVGPDPIDEFMKKDRSSSKLYALLDKIKTEGQSADNREMCAQDPTVVSTAAKDGGVSSKSTASGRDGNTFDAENPEKRGGIDEGLLMPDATEAKREVPDPDLESESKAEPGNRIDTASGQSPAAPQKAKADEDDRQRQLFEDDSYIGLP